ncbi:T9SS type A sorting domain-containing protein [Mucilaginibacter sp. CAU 1740]|uniref:T9SS type A sorting domain-containing protein n=1 Tax=Mucilaginibacter sp. CAU 1740 TaxID=3140365 RepID=UPI00325C254C
MKNTIILILFLFINSVALAAQLDWVGGASPNPNSWADKNNWRIGPLDLSAPSSAPTTADDVNILLTGNQPIVLTGTTAVCKSLTMAASNGIILTVNGTLTVSGMIMQNPPLVSLLGLGGTVTATIAGTGTVNCASMQVGSTTFLGLAVATVNQLSIISTVNNLKITGDLSIYGTSNSVVIIVSLLQVNNSAFYVRGGTTTIGGQIFTNTTAGTGGILDISLFSSATATFTIDVPSGSSLTPKVVLTNATPIKSTSNAGSIDFYNNGGGSGTCTVEYAGTAAQTVYTETATQLNISPTAYQNIAFSAAGNKNITSGDLTVFGNWTSVSGKVDAVSNNPNVIFKGTTQSLSDTASDAGKGVVFKNVFFQNSGTKTMSGSGKFSVSSLGILTMAGTSTALATGGILTLISDASGSATVASIPSGNAITGNVNVQRYINGGAWYYRGYRLLSSPVNNGSGNFNLEYLKLSAFVTGTTKAAGGFDTSPNANNPSIYFFRENTAYSSSQFTTGNFRGVNSLGSTPYSFDNESSAYNLPIGNGFLFFFRGDRSSGIASATVASHVPENTTFTATGALNQGNTTVKQWYSGGALLYTTTVGSRVQGYNLVGNPYASTINFEKFNRKGTSGLTADAASSIYISGQKAQIYTTTPANVPPLAFIWVVNPTTKQYETYQQKATAISTADTTTNINPGIQSVVGGAASNMIASGQGFFVRATASGQTMTFRESAKTNTQPNSATLVGVFSLPKDKPPIAMAAANMQNKFAAAVPTGNDAAPYQWPMPLMRLRLIKDSINFDAVVIVLVKDISAAYNADKDAEDLGSNGAPESLSALSSDSVKITIHRRPIPGKLQETIPLYVDATTSGDYKLSLTELKDLPDLYQVWIKDNLTKDSVLAKTNSDYNFTIDKSNPASFGTNRFQLIVRQNNAEMAKVLDFNAQKAINGSKLIWTTANAANYTAYVAERSIDNGKTFSTLDTVYANGSNSYSLVDTKPLQGLNQYRLTQIDLNGDTTLSKVVPLMYADTKTNVIAETMNIYPNPATDVIHAQMLLKNDGTVKYKVNITNSEGKVMATATTSQATWQNNVGSFIPGTYIMQVVNSSNNTVIGVKKFVKK